MTDPNRASALIRIDPPLLTSAMPTMPSAASVDSFETRNLMHNAQPHARRCTAKSKRSGGRCKNPPVRGRTVCRMHGGASPVGAASPQYKGAGRFKYLPVAMAERYRAAKADPELLALRKDLALLEVRLSTLLERVTETGPADVDAATWAEIRELVQERLRIVEAEYRRLAATHQLVPLARALMVMQEIATVIARHVTDKATLSAINAEFARLVSIEGPTA